MNKFVSSLLGSFAGTWIAFFVFGVFIFFFGIAAISSMSFSSAIPKVESNSILCINLTGTIKDKPDNKTLSELVNENWQVSENLHDILIAINHAETNDNIEGIYLNCGSVDTGIATASAIRNALSDFKKKSGKWVYAYGHGFSQKDYYIASVADSIFMNPSGSLDIHGLTSTTMFFKGALDKLGIEMQIIRVGTYKSAVEPFMLTSMSEASKLQTQTYIDNIWNEMCNAIAKSRKIDSKTIVDFADSLSSFKLPEIALNAKLIDGVCYQHEFDEKMKELSGISQSDDLRLVSANTMANTPGETNTSNREIAVLFAEGEINMTGDSHSINADDIVPQIIELADNDEVKGLVLRVNSPGGSAYASEQIWEALEYFKSKNKPLAVAMGDYAASGGYYISCGADCIFAEPTTITGSIGIYGMIPSAKKLMNETIGITTDYVTTTPNANISLFEPLTPNQMAAIQANVNKGYELFTRRCAQGRDVSVDSIKAIAEGRVWDGKNALKIGLVDQFGGIDDAVKWVANKAKLGSDFRTAYYPEYTMDFLNMIYSSFEVSVKNGLLQNNQWAEYVMQVQQLLNKDKLQCRMENIHIN